jgi:hypothetical protein
LSLSLEEIESEINKFDKDSKALKKEIFKIAWFMRGSVDIDQAFALSYDDRVIINEIIQENIKLTQETSIPFI